MNAHVESDTSSNGAGFPVMISTSRTRRIQNGTSLLVGATSYLSSDCYNVSFGLKFVGRVRIDSDGDAGTPPILAPITTTHGQSVELAEETNGRRARRRAINAS